MLEIDAILGALTLEEKAALVSGADFWRTVAVDRLGVPAIMCSDGPHGLRAQMNEADHVGLAGSVPATCFPTASAIASSWDVGLLHEVGEAIAAEARRWNVSVVLGPGVNIKRSPLCGRNFEYLSEDPFLSAELGVALVDGIQSRGVGASVKHFAANNQEDDRLRVSADVDERTLREIYLPAFEQIAERAAPWTVMCAYNKVNGIHASEHRWLLTEVLRDEWGWDGVVLSDWGACHDRVASLRAGLDWEMPPDLERSPHAVIDAVEAGDLDIDVLDRSVRRMLSLVDRAMGVLETEDSFDEAAHHALARRAAAESIVLLKNEGDLLPIRAGSVAVVGEFARTPRFQGAGSSQVNPTRVDRAIDELEHALGQDRVRFCAGYVIGDDVEDDERLRDEAVRVAAQVDTVVCVLGLPSWYESEGFDRTHMELPDNQLALLEAVVAANPDVVVVLVNGSTIRSSHWDHSVPAIVEAWLGGQAAGGAIADVLTGAVNPSGRLAETMPIALSDVPSSLNFPGDSGHVRYGEGLFVGYRAHDRLGQTVSYPFGHGLSYTTFEYGEVAVRTSGRVGDGDLSVTVEVPVSNTGDHAGAETVQVYVRDLESSVVRPPRELKGFAKIRLEPNETAPATVVLDQRAFSFWSERLRRWTVEAGDFVIEVGSSSRDIRGSVTVSIDAPSIAAPLTEGSTLHEWLADPYGAAALGAIPGMAPFLAQGDLVSVIGTMPLDTLASFPGLGLDHHRLTELISTIPPEHHP
jgi:beta-glucosidase